MTPDDYCTDKAAKSGSSFYYSFLFLPPEKKRAITALYAFCREVDDAVDETRTPEIAAMKLAWWENQLEELYGGIPEHPVMRALAPVVERHGLRRELFLEIIRGMEMDIHQSRYSTFSELELYCYRAAGVVGELSVQIFGFEDPNTLRYARELGTALQLTNILRDVGEDARRGRIYLPQEDLARFGVENVDILQGKAGENFEKLMAFQIERARSFYQKALASLPDKDRENQKVGLVMAAVYRTLLERIAENPAKVLHERISLSPIRKLWLAWKTWMKR